MLTGRQGLTSIAQEKVTKARKIRESSSSIQNSGVTDQVRRVCSEQQEKFVHPAIPLVQETDVSKAAKLGALKWTPFTDLCKDNFRIAETTPSTLHAGCLTGAFLFNAMAILNERRDLLFRLLGDDWKRSDSAYQVWINSEGHWLEQVVDDLAPVVDQNSFQVKIASTVTNSEELWPLLIEKAYALTFGGWEKVQTGSFCQAIRDLTGAAYSSFKDLNDVELIWDRLLASQSKSWITCFSFQTTEGIANGLWPDEFYLVLAVKSVKLAENGKVERLIQIKDHRETAKLDQNRNKSDSLGATDFRFEYSELDRTAWVNIETLVRMASSMTVFMVEDAFHTWTSLDQSNQEKSLVLFELNSDTDLVLSVDHPDHRIAQTDTQTSYVRVTLARLSSSSAQFVDCRLSAQHSIFVSDALPEGRYCALIEGYWSDTDHRCLNLALTSDRPVRLLTPSVSSATLSKLEYWTWTNFATNNKEAFTSRQTRLSDLQA